MIEDLWLETPLSDPHRDLYKGVIQAAAAIYQWDRGILTGARGLYRSSSHYLAAYLPAALGLNVAELKADLDLLFTPFESWDGSSRLVRDPKMKIRMEFKV